MSKNNAKMVQQKMADQKQRFGIRKLSVGAASVLLGTVFYLQSGTVYADVNPAASVGNDSINVVNKNSSTSSSAEGSSTSNSAGSSNSVSSAGDATNSMDTRQVSASPVESATSQANKNAVDAGNEQGSSVPASHVNEDVDKTVKNENANVDSHQAYVPNSQVALEKPVAGSGRVDSRGKAPFKPVLAMKAETEAPVAKPAVDSEAPKRETVDSKWIIHYVNQADHKQELKDPTVITMQYARTNTPQSDGKTQYGDWSYVPGSFKQTGTAITVNDSDNPVKQDNVDKDDENMDVFTITAMYPTIAGYTMHNNINGTRLHDDLENDNRQADTMSKDFYAEYDVAKERSVAVKFIDDQFNDFGTIYQKQVGQAITLTGRDGDTVDLKLTVPDKYKLADGQQLPTTYTFKKGSSDVMIRLKHQVAQREATIDVQLALITSVHFGNTGFDQSVVTQAQWNQLDDELKSHGPGPQDILYPLVKVGTLTGHVGYDLVNGQVVSFGDDWTTLNLGGRTYQLPDGTEIANGIVAGYVPSFGKKLKSVILADDPDVDTDYVNRPWYGYLSVNATNNDDSFEIDATRRMGLQAGLVGDKPNALAKAIGDRAATAVEMSNKAIDTNSLQNYDFTFNEQDNYDFNEQDGQLRADVHLFVAGVYIPYVEKTATRTINVTTPDGKTTTVEQTATLAKQIEFNKDVHPDWTTGEWVAYNVPTIPGYTASQTSVAKKAVAGETKDQTVNITYTANPQTATVIYQTEDGISVYTTTVNGHTGQTVKVSNEVPVGWHLVNGKVPSEITFGANGTPKTVVTIAHSHVTVTPDAPKTTSDKLPDNPAKTYPAGVSETDLNKTITRTIKVTTPDGQTKTVAQTAKLTRTADVDEVTGEVKYNDWTTGEWDKYDVPTVPGYTASQSNIAQQAVTDATKDQTIEITYTANEHQISVEYVDNATGKILKTDHMSGKTGQTVPITPHIPDGWELVSGQSVPSEVTLGADGAPATVIKVQPQERSVAVKFIDDQSFDPDTIDFRKRVGQAITVTGRDGDTVDLKLMVPDKYKLADGQQLPTSYTFEKGSGDLTIHLVHQVVQREATVDVQMGLVAAVLVNDGDLPLVTTQNRWAQLDDKIKDDGQPNERMYPLVKVGTLAGHVGYDLVDNKVVSFADDWTTLNLGSQTYQMPDGTEVVNGILVDYYRDALGEPFKEYLLKYHPDADPDYINRPWHGYLSVNATNKLLSDNPDDNLHLQVGLVGNKPNTLAKAIGDQAATAVKTANKTINLRLFGDDELQNDTDDELQNDTCDITTRDFSEQNGRLQGIAELEVDGVYIPYVEKTATRTINVTTPDGKTTTVKQTATLAKQIDFGKDVHPAWTTSEWTSYDVPVIPGYTASQSSVAKEAVTGTTKDQIVNITYTANPQTTHVNYVDAQGKLIHATTVTGQTGQTVKVSSEIPDGWKLVDGQTVPSTITFGPDGHADMSVKIEHRHVTVTPDKPQANGTELPDNPKQSFHGVEASDLNKTVTRMIKVTTPIGKINTIKQEAKLTRTATVDEVTGDVSYGDWSIGQWDAYQVPSLTGYTATQPEVAATSVNENTTDQTVDVSYTPNKQSTTIKYVGDDNQVVHTTTVNGVTDQTVKVPNEVPAGWMITNGNVPSEITFGVDGHEPIEVTVARHHVTVDPTDPKNPTDTLPDNPAKNYPAGVSESDLNKTITRTIKITQPDGTATNNVQTVKLTRTADVDEVTDEVTYGKWTTGAWDAYEIPSAKGYTASQASVAAMPVTSDTKDQTVEVSYTPNTQSTVVKYVDDKGQVVHTTTITGKTGATVKVPSEVPAGWMITKGEVPNEITFGVDGHEPIEIAVDHRHVTVDPAHPQTNGTKLSDNPAKTFEGVEANDLNKTITRTIKITQSDGQIKTVTQSVKLTRTADVDEVTGEVTYGKWTTGKWSNYSVPAVPGYTASQNEVPAAEVTNDMTDQTINVSYTSNKQSTTIKYVDDAGKIVHTTTVDGVTDQTVKVPNEVPAGWMITKGQVPSEITFGADGHEAIEVTVAHRHVTVTPDQSQNNGTKLPDNPAKTFNGVETSDLNKTITRMIKVTTPDGQTKTVTQTTKLTRTADVDEVTSDVKYGEWSTGQWDDYAVSTVPGYTASQTSVASTPVDGNTKDQTIDVHYTANSQTTHINYVNDEGKTIHTTIVTGKTGKTVKVPNEVPAGWMITKGEVPSEISFGPNGHTDDTITIGHQHVTVDQDHPQNNGTKLPDNPAKPFNGVEANDLNKTITRTIKVTTPDGKSATTKQTAKLTRTADVDEVTGEVTYGNWTTGEWSAYDAPSVPGYTPSKTMVAKESVTATSKNTTVEISYLPMQYQISVEYVDDDDHGKIVKTDQVPGKTDQTITVTPSAPANYDLVDNSNRTYTVTSDAAQAVQIHVKHHQVTTSESKTVTRTINVHTPHDGVKTIKQNAELTRKVTTDQVTGNKTYGDWTTGQWKAYTPETIPGYTPSINEVPNTNVNGNSKNQMVDVTYTADAQKVEIVYVDDTKGGAVVKTDQVAGKTDETVKVTPDVPAGYELVGKVTGDYTMVADGHQTITVHLVHQMKTASESKAVTRTINVNTPHDGTTVFKQTVDLSRDVTTDQVTGDKTYGDWSTTEWTHYDVPAVAGYTPSIKQVAQQVVNGMTMDQTIDVTYSSGEHTTHINYVDGDGNIVHTTMIKGQTDGTAQVPNETPAGWMVVGKPVPTEITFGPDGHADVTVTVDHKHVTVTPDQSKAPTDKLPDNPGKTYPNGVGHDDLNRTVTRTIRVVTPDGQTKTVTQTAKLIRTADVDEVTGEVTYGKWTTGEWSRYKVPSVPGYTVSQSDVPAVNVTDTTKDQMLTLTYTANDQTTHVTYVDSDGKTVHTTTITGKTDQTVKVPNEVPTGWTITNGQVPAEITFGPDGHADVVVTVGHQHVTVTPDQPKTPSDKLPNNPGKTYPSGVGHDDLNKTVTRTIKVTTPDGKTQTTAQKVQLTRTADVDEVTGEVTYCKWTTGEWANYDVPAVPGYTASQSNVLAAKVTSDTKNQTVTVTYTANAQTTTISYVDQNGKTVHTTVINGHTDQTVKVPNEVPAGWTIIAGQVPSEVAFGPDGNPDVTVTVDHQHVTVPPDQPKTSTDKLPDNPAKTYPNGVEHDDLNKTVTRTIKVITPDGQTKTVVQTAKLTRTANVDEVTGEVTYGKWTTSEWSSYEVPAAHGYTASQNEVPAVKVTDDTKDQTVAVTYTANDQTTHINYVDGNGKIVNTTTITGKTDQTVKVPNEVPTGWTITNGQVPSEVIFGANGYDDVTVTVGHQHVTVTPDKPKTNGTQLPDNPRKTFRGVSETDLNKVVTRAIEVASPVQKTTTVKQTAKLTRTADVDEVTGEVTYGKWATGSWSSYTVPTVAGYTPSQAVVAEVAVDANTADQTVKITYTADSHTTHINYVDKDGNVVHTTTVTGATGQTVKVPNEVPADWKVTGESMPTELTFGPDGHADVTVTVDHQHVMMTPDKPRENDTKLSNTISKSTQSAQTTSQSISIRTSQTSTPQTTNKDHESQLPQATNDVHARQLPQTGNKSDSQLELLGFIGIAVAGLFGFGTRRKKRD